MNQLSKIKKLSNLSYLDKNTLSQFIELSDNSLYANIKRWLKAGDLIQLKRGMYVTADYISGLNNKDAYMVFLANKLREPSYLSMETVLQNYNMVSEAVYGWTSVTLKTKRIYKNKFGAFIYRNIKELLFDGYEIKAVGGFDIRVASRAKALFDYLYFKLLKVREVDGRIIESLRLNWDEFPKNDLVEFTGYCELSHVGKMAKLPDIIRTWI